MSWKENYKTVDKYKSRTLIYGDTGVGKTHFEANVFPKPYFIDMDNSLTHKWNYLEKYCPENISDFLKLAKEIAKDEKDPDIDTIVLDIDHIVAQYADAWAKELKWPHIEGDGFNHEWKIMKVKMRVIFGILEEMNEKYHICLTAHSNEIRKKAFELDVTTTKMAPNIHKELVGDIMAWCSNIFYIHTESDIILKQIKGKQRSYTKAQKRSKENIRIIEMADNAHYEAKNRCDLPQSARFEENFDYAIIRDAILGGGYVTKIDTGLDDVVDENEVSNDVVMETLKEHEEEVIYYCINFFYALKEGQGLTDLSDKTMGIITNDLDNFIERALDKWNEKQTENKQQGETK